MVHYAHLAILTALVGGGCASDVAGSQGGSGGSGAGGSGGESSCPATPDLEGFVMGTGEHCFEPIEEGSVLPLYAGPQGGYHVWLAIGCTDCGPSVDVEWFAIDPATGEMLEGALFSEQIVDLEGVWPHATGLIVAMPGDQFDTVTTPPPPAGTRFILHARTWSGPAYEMNVEVEIGALEMWDPCQMEPDHPLCNTL